MSAREYVTEVYVPRARPELQVMHKKAMEAETAQLGGNDDLRPDDQHPDERNQPMPTVTRPAARWAVTRPELDAATARTADVIAQGGSPADVLRAAEIEEAGHRNFLRRPGADEELQRDAEAQWEAGA